MWLEQHSSCVPASGISELDWSFLHASVTLSQENVPLMILFSSPNKENVFLTCLWNTPWHKQITHLMPFQFTDKMKLCNQLCFGEKMTEADENTPGSDRLSGNLLYSAVMTNIFCHHSVFLISQINASHAVKLPSEI